MKISNRFARYVDWRRKVAGLSKVIDFTADDWVKLKALFDANPTKDITLTITKADGTTFTGLLTKADILDTPTNLFVFQLDGKDTGTNETLVRGGGVGYWGAFPKLNFINAGSGNPVSRTTGEIKGISYSMRDKPPITRIELKIGTKLDNATILDLFGINNFWDLADNTITIPSKEPTLFLDNIETYYADIKTVKPGQWSLRIDIDDTHWIQFRINPQYNIDLITDLNEAGKKVEFSTTTQQTHRFTSFVEALNKAIGLSWNWMNTPLTIPTTDRVKTSPIVELGFPAIHSVIDIGHWLERANTGNWSFRWNVSVKPVLTFANDIYTLNAENNEIKYGVKIRFVSDGKVSFEFYKESKHSTDYLNSQWITLPVFNNIAGELKIYNMTLTGTGNVRTYAFTDHPDKPVGIVSAPTKDQAGLDKWVQLFKFIFDDSSIALPASGKADVLSVAYITAAKAKGIVFKIDNKEITQIEYSTVQEYFWFHTASGNYDFKPKANDAYLENGSESLANGAVVLLSAVLGDVV